MGRPWKLPLLPEEDRVGWGLVRVPQMVAKVTREHRRHDCVHLRVCEEAFVQMYGSEQGRCPKDCGGYISEPATLALEQFAQLLGERINDGT